MERYVRTIKETCLNRLIFVGEQSLRRAIAEFVTHYHYERNHQGRGNQLRIEIAGISSEPDAAWMSQVSRQVTDANDGFLRANAS